MNRQSINLHLANNNFGRKGFTLNVNRTQARYEACAIVWSLTKVSNPAKAAEVKAEAQAIWEATK